jgi:hypothetical protein
MAYAEHIPSQDPNKTDEEIDFECALAFSKMCRRERTAAQLAEEMGISRATFFRRIDKYRLPRTLRPPRKSRPGRQPPRSDVGYVRAHQRVRDIKGQACEHLCCKCSEGATNWAYTNDDPNELVDGQGLRYSLDPDRYVPMCRSCHLRFDAAHRRAS